VARREFVERARDKGFVVSTAITLLILVGVIVATALLDRGTRFDLAVVRDGSPVGRQVVAAADALGFDVTLHTYRDEAAATSAVRGGDADAALLDPGGSGEIVVRSDPPEQLVGVVQVVSLRARSEAALEAAGLSEEQVRDAIDQPALPVRALEPRDDRERENATVAYVGVIALYGQIFAYGYWVAAGVVEEKSSRVVEVLLATLRPSQLLRGKILGIGLLGLAQLVLIGAVGLTTAQLLGRIEFPTGAITAIALVVGWFVIGFFFYAGLFAVAGSIVTRQEDLQTTMTPLTLVIVASFFVGLSATGNPSSTLATVASFLPPSAPLVMPSRMVLGEIGIPAALGSAALSIAVTILLVPVATTIYARAVLQSGRVRIRSVVRAGRA
jgi:ABC-2 type transport system permease protein